MGHENPQAVHEVKRTVGFLRVNAVLCKHDINVVVIETDYTFGYVLKTIPAVSILTDGSCRPSVFTESVLQCVRQISSGFQSSSVFTLSR
jgi:hypothetical protein